MARQPKVDVPGVLQEKGCHFSPAIVSQLQLAVPQLLAAGKWVGQTAGGQLQTAGGQMSRADFERRCGRKVVFLWNDYNPVIKTDHESGEPHQSPERRRKRSARK